MTRVISIGDVKIGGGNPIAIQSMTNTKTHDVEATVAQIEELSAAGCDIVRVAVPDFEAARALSVIKSRVRVPLVADIHFDYKLALESIEGGVDKIRINPGNIGPHISEVARAARERGIPIRVGVNGGSLHKDILGRYGNTAIALAESAAEHIELLRKHDFDNIVIAIKSSDVPKTVAACGIISERYDYPLHLGVTEAGGEYDGSVKSAVGIGALLLRGIGDTIRVTLTAPPIREVYAAKAILRAVGKPVGGVEVISCPTCGRCGIDLIKIADEVRARTRDIKKTMKVAVMGCVVNGPGEAREADIGIAGGEGTAALFKNGAVVRKIVEKNIVEELMREIEGYVNT